MKTEQKEMKVELKGDREVVITRYFAAPRQLVFDCHTKPELMRRWLIGPPGMTLEKCELDLRTGGRYLYVYSGAGTRMGVYGKFTEVVVPEIVANTENYAMDMSTFNPDAPEDPAATFESRTFTTEGSGTLLTHYCKYPTAEMREMSGATEGWAECYKELDKLFSEIG